MLVANKTQKLTVAPGTVLAVPCQLPHSPGATAAGTDRNLPHMVQVHRHCSGHNERLLYNMSEYGEMQTNAPGTQRVQSIATFRRIFDKIPEGLNLFSVFPALPPPAHTPV